MPETAGIKLTGPTPAWLDNELPGLGILVTVMPDEVLAALPVMGAAETERDDAEADAVAAAALDEPGYAGEEEASLAAAGDGEEVDADADDDDGMTPGMGRNFLLDRSMDPDD